MDTEHHNSEPGSTDGSSKMMDWTGKEYRRFMDYVAFRDDDPTWMLGYKLILRFLGILFMIILSPFLILGLIIAFIAVF
ncbi:MAG: hypothetical protein R2824_09180 [Saprospiraceae bacterium]|nr:hypothetical protein [Lewinella sp.]